MGSNAMGSVQPDLITIEEAADMLEVCSRTVETMIKRGLLTPVHVHNHQKRFLTKTEVATVASIKAKKMDVATVANIAIRALAAAQTAQRQLADVYALLGLNRSPLSLEESDVVALQVQVQDEVLRTRPHSADEIREWSKIFLNVSEEYLRVVALHTSSDQPWRDFLVLAEQLSAESRTSIIDPLLVAAFTFLEPARRHLRQVAYFYATQAEGVRAASKKIPKGGEGTDEALINLLFLH